MLQRGEGGFHRNGPLYKAPIYYQKGHGVGGLFAGLAKFLLPILKDTGRALGRQSIKTGKAIVSSYFLTRKSKQNQFINFLFTRHFISNSKRCRCLLPQNCFRSTPHLTN